jgi:hypothetical protein
MKIIHISFLICLLTTVFSPAFSQEKLVSVAGNPALGASRIPAPLKSVMNDTLGLPLLDDFSKSFPYPDPMIWSDNHAFINNTFPLNTPTYGVATMDAIDSTGKIYTEATVESFFADALTSRPVDLFLPADTTTYLSFLYQPQGLGDAPEPGDSLVVEFWAPAFKKWYRVWSAPGSPVKDFRIAMINITDSRFLQKGFRFRFRNYASLAPAYEPSLKVNADHWNIDYVYLNNHRSFDDIVMHDASVVRSVGSLLQNYTAMPWEHFRVAGISSVKAIFQININNLSAEKRNYAPNFRIAPVWTPGAAFEKSYPSDAVKAGERLNYDASFNYNFPGSEKDSALFEISLDMNQELTDQIPGNDKVVSLQLFSDYYAYDDGTSEAGYGLVGEGARNGMVAYRFQNLRPGDSLQAVDILFNRSFADAGKKYFRIAVWADDNNKPGELIYLQDGALPTYNGLNAFQRIPLDTAQVVSGTYYVGWQQPTADFLNVGFDKQNNHAQDIFYNLSGTWQATGFEGSLMMRPVFSNKSRKTGIEPVDAPKATARIFPNPSADFVRIDCGDEAAIIRIQLTDLQGRTIKSALESGPICKLSVTDVPNGIYLITVTSDSGINTRQKLMIIHEQ